MEYTFPIYGNITLAGLQQKLLVAAVNGIFYCHISCTGCYGSTSDHCFTCSSLTRGYQPFYPTYARFVAVTPYSCPCRENFIEENKKDCKCPDAFY